MKKDNKRNNYKIITKLGAGSFGQIYKVLNIKDNKHYALKRIDIENMNEEELLGIENVAKILSSLNNEYIIKYYDSFIENNEYFNIIMEYCEYSDLRQFINKKRKEKKLIDQNVILFILLNICTGLKEIHKKRIIHRNLKPETLLISNDYKIKIGGFSVAKKLNDDEYISDQVGTYSYMAPEIFSGKEYNNKVDIWSLGCIIYELCTLKECFEGYSIIKLYNKIMSEMHEKINTNYYNKKIQDLIDKLLIKDYEKRYEIDKVYDLVIKYNKKLFLKNNINNLDEISKNILHNQKNYINANKEHENEIIMTIEINENDINKEIYFLDNTDYTDKRGIKHYHNYLKELNEHNVELYINDNKYRYEKFFKFKEKGIYEIKLIFKNLLQDCSYMFSNCYKLTNIDLSNFETRNINNMSHMFYECYNLTNIDLSFIDTKNVINMSHIFFRCNNLDNLDLSDFDTKNVTNMKKMFYECNNLTKLNLSNFDTKNVVDMSGMFYCCENLTKLDLSNFDTKNVTDMSCMFWRCYKLAKIDLSKFDSCIVTDMRDMFYGCKNLKDFICNDNNINKNLDN